MKELRTEVVIHATPERVWQILTDFAQYGGWNPFIHQAVGTAKVGEKVDISFRSGSRQMTLHCQVVKAEPNRELRWKYHVVLPGLFRGEHSFAIEPIGDGQVRLIDEEVFHGLLVPLQARDIDTNSRKGFEAMDKALQARAEAGE